MVNSTVREIIYTLKFVIHLYVQADTLHIHVHIANVFAQSTQTNSVIIYGWWIVFSIVSWLDAVIASEERRIGPSI